MLYELYKKVYELDRNGKEFLYKNWNDIVEALSDDFENIVTAKKKNWYKRIPNKDILFGEIDDVDTKRKPENGEYEYIEQQDRTSPMNEMRSDIIKDIYKLGALDVSLEKVAMLFDPETEEHMEKLIGLMEKFVGLDNDISYDNICIFLHPLSRGARKYILRPYQMIGLTKELERLSRKFKNRTFPPSEKLPIGVPTSEQIIDIMEDEETDPKIMEMFLAALNSIKEKLNKRKIPGVHPQKKSANLIIANVAEIVADNALEDLISRLKDKGWSREDILFLMENNPDFSYGSEELNVAISKFFS